MCGIVGVLDFSQDISGNHSELLREMNERQIHRGPDGEGYFESGPIGLGHRRLAIIDIEHGDQPMLSHDQRYVLSFNGEIYNYLELRDELIALDRHFITDSDTEVLLQAFEEWGPDCVTHFNGDFAFAVWDSLKEELFLLRDRLGVKPLYYTEIGTTLLFASEVEALLASPDVKRTIDISAMTECLAYFQPLNPKTLIKEVYSIAPGHWMRIHKGGKELVRYWDIEYKPCLDDFETAKRHICDLVTDATKLRMQADVPVGAFLSGGLDSSVLCTVMANATSDSLDTFSLDFSHEQGGRDSATHVHGADLEYAKKVADAIESNHHSIVVESDEYYSRLAAGAGRRSLPATSGSEAGISVLAHRARSKMSVAISGEGADEVALGYYMFIEDSLKAGQVRPFFAVPANKFMFFMGVANRLRYRPLTQLKESFRSFIKSMPHLWESEDERIINTVHYLQLKYVLPYLLDRADRLTMQHSLELRVPFCDHRLVEYFFNLSPDIKYLLGKEKNLLREAFRGIVLDEVVDRKKSVFPYPGSKQELDTLFKHTLSAAKSDTREAKLVRSIFPISMLRVIIFGARRGWVPSIGAHYICTFYSTMISLCGDYELTLEG